jgi:hypothetical protein
MVLKIERSEHAGQRVLRLSGQVKADELNQVRAEIGALDIKTSLDLGEVALVDIEAARFLADCELKGVILLHCPLYIREWINREGKRPI